MTFLIEMISPSSICTQTEIANHEAQTGLDLWLDLSVAGESRVAESPEMMPEANIKVRLYSSGFDLLQLSIPLTNCTL
jgi:hypothetical protein